MGKMNSYFRDVYSYFAYLWHRLTVALSPELEINRCYKKVFGHKANLISPKSLVEKIYWMQLHCDTSQWSILADKYRMRDYVISKGYESNLPKLYGMWKDPNQINIDQLPSSFVIKANNGCGSVLVIKDKSAYDWGQKKREIAKWLKFPFGYSGYEPHYFRIPPCIIAEELLEQDKELNEISPSSMIDYKFWCFNAHVECCLVTYNRTSHGHTIDLYDMNWHRLTSHLHNHKLGHYNPNVEIPRPKCLDTMIEIASNLSKGYPEMRVDLYIVNNKPIIGELTMSAGYGSFTEEYYDYLGSFVDMSILKRIK